MTIYKKKHFKTQDCYYKVFKVGRYTLTSMFWKAQREFPLDEWVNEKDFRPWYIEDKELKYVETGEEYPLSFHAFLRKRDAKRYCKDGVVFKINIRGIVASGRTLIHDKYCNMIAAKEMKIMAGIP